MKKKTLALAAVAAAALTGELYRYVFCRGGSPLFNLFSDNKNHVREFTLYRDGAAQRLRSAKQERMTIPSDRGEVLCGFYLPCGEKPSGKIAFLVHGYRSDHAEAAGMFMDYYHSRGFDLFCCDHTASGESGGKLIGYDVYESQDCLKWLKVLTERFGENTQIVLHGFSMGGATVLKMSDRVPENVRFIVSDCGFADAGAVSGYARAALAWAVENGILYGKDGNRLDPKGTATRAECAALLWRFVSQYSLA